jgi:hypothetical protein
MTKRSPQLLTAICDTVASGILSQAEAARRNGVSVASFWAWVAQPQKGEAGFVFEYCGEQMSFHQAIALARKIALHDVLGRFEQRAHYGSDEPVFYQGRPEWKEDESLSGLDDEMIAALGYPDRFERDANGQRIQLTIHHEPPVAGVIKVLEANFPRQYGQKSEVNINQKTQAWRHRCQSELRPKEIARACRGSASA